MANTGLLLEVLVTSFVLLLLLTLFSLHYFSMTILLKNEDESQRILQSLTFSDDIVSHVLSVERMGIYTNNLVDCSKLPSVCPSLGDAYVSCGGYSCGAPDGKIIVKRLAVYNGKVVVVEVGR